MGSECGRLTLSSSGSKQLFIRLGHQLTSSVLLGQQGPLSFCFLYINPFIRFISEQMLFLCLSLTGINVRSTKAINSEKIELIEFRAKLSFLSELNSSFFSIQKEICFKKIHQGEKEKRSLEETIV